MGKVITFGTLKGGTGKTTAVFCAAGILAQKGFKVLVIDVDPQANITSNLGVVENSDGYVSVKELFENENMPVEEAIIKAPIEELPTLDIIGSTVALTSTEFRIISSPSREFIMKTFLKKNKKYLDNYDYIIIDTNPSMSIINQNCFIVSDAIILVSDIGVNALKGLELFIALWQDILEKLGLKDNIKGLLINKFNENSEFSNEFIQYCKDEEDLSKILFENYIPFDEKLLECELERKPINLLYKDHDTYSKINSFVTSLVNRLD